MLAFWATVCSGVSIGSPLTMVDQNCACLLLVMFAVQHGSNLGPRAVIASGFCIAAFLDAAVQLASAPSARVIDEDLLFDVN